MLPMQRLGYMKMQTVQNKYGVLSVLVALCIGFRSVHRAMGVLGRCIE